LDFSHQSQDRYQLFLKIVSAAFCANVVIAALGSNIFVIQNLLIAGICVAWFSTGSGKLGQHLQFAVIMRAFRR
jgi:hypothetical protein